MEMSSLFFHFLLLLVLLRPLSLSATLAAPTAAETAYEVLQSHGLPRGLLPPEIKEFRFVDSGRFEAVLDAACTATFEGQVHYNASVSGQISYGQIASLSGVSAQELFLWFPVIGISVDVPSSGVIDFDVGVVHKRFPVSLFESPPVCTPDSAPAPSSREHALPRIANAVSMRQRQNGKLRSILDQGDVLRPAVI